MLTAGSLEARPFRVDQIPNGQVNQCANCHINPAGGGARTPFGNAVFQRTGSFNRAFWDAVLAGEDSDGDGFTNGQELGDPDGDFIAIPGASISNPGIAASIPNQPPSISISQPTGGASFLAPATVVIEVAAQDTDGSVVRVDFFAGTQSIGTQTAPPFTLTWNDVPTGTYSLTAKATDNAGATAVSAPVEIVVEQPASPPVTILSPQVEANFIRFSFATELGSSYTVQYNTEVTGGVWQTLTTVTGTGSVEMVQDPNQGNRKFYRVLSE